MGGRGGRVGTEASGARSGGDEKARRVERGPGAVGEGDGNVGARGEVDGLRGKERRGGARNQPEVHSGTVIHEKGIHPGVARVGEGAERLENVGSVAVSDHREIVRAGCSGPSCTGAVCDSTEEIKSKRITSAGLPMLR